LIEFEIVVLLAKNLILINKFYKFLREVIRVKKTIKSFELDILDKIVKCKIKEKYRDLVFRYSINSKLVIESSKSSSC